MLKKAWNKIFNCACTVKKDQKNDEEFLVLRGDHMKKIAELLVEEGIGTRENIATHGWDI